MLVYRQSCVASQHESKLYNSLLHGYVKQTRPVKRHEDPVRVKLSLSLIEVLGLDDNKITVKTWLTLVIVGIHRSDFRKDYR